MSTEAAARKFFSSSAFAVAGASSNPAKFGHKGSPSVTVGGKEYATVPNVGALENPKETGLSVITAPPITANLLKEAKEAGIPSVFLQPGTFDDEVLKFALAEGNFEAVVYGFGPGTRGGEGWCVLVDGERELKNVGKL